MYSFLEILQKIDTAIWQPLFVILTGAGLFLTYRLRGLQFRYLGYALKLAFSHKDEKSEGDISHFQALMTALAATIGIGNIAGVATAITIGGVGALFWLWITALIGMIIKYSEAILAIRYRTTDKRGEMAGGPMYYLERGLGWRGLALLFAAFGMGTAFFTGNLVQSNAIVAAIADVLPINLWVLSGLLALCTGLVVIGGIKSIGKVASLLVPIMALAYILGSLCILVLYSHELPHALSLILTSAFTGQAAAGGFAGSTLLLAIQMGVARGVFSNESGLGSSPIAAASAQTDMPGRQALISMTGAFLSTLVCTFTGLAIAVTHVLGSVDGTGRLLDGVLLTMASFGVALPYGNVLVVIGSLLFGYTTILGWAFYGEKCCEYLFKGRGLLAYRLLFSLCVLFGIGVPIQVVWALADIANACMALPNLIGVVALSGVVVTHTHLFLDKVRQEKSTVPN